MKQFLITTIVALLLVGCGESQSPEPPKVKAPDISIASAAFKGNIEAVKQHLAAGTDVNAQNLNGFYPLTSAASWGHNEIVELLIAKLNANETPPTDNNRSYSINRVCLIARSFGNVHFV